MLGSGSGKVGAQSAAVIAMKDPQAVALARATGQRQEGGGGMGMSMGTVGGRRTGTGNQSTTAMAM